MKKKVEILLWGLFLLGLTVAIPIALVGGVAIFLHIVG